MFLLQGSLGNEEWVREIGLRLGNSKIEAVTYYVPQQEWGREQHFFKFEPRYDDIYERIETVITADEQFEEWCKMGVNHRRENDWFYRETEKQGFEITFNTFKDFADFCLTYEAGSYPSEYRWSDGSGVIVLTDEWNDDDY